MEIAPLQMTPVSMQAESHLGETKPQAETKSFGDYLTAALKKTKSGIRIFTIDSVNASAT